MTQLLRWVFPVEEAYSVFQETHPDDNSARQNYTVLRVYQTAPGFNTSYDILIVESKSHCEPWGSSVDYARNHLEQTTTNKSKQVYGAIQIGLQVQFYKYNGKTVRPLHQLGGRYHLVQHAQEITDTFRWMKSHPLPAVEYEGWRDGDA